MSSIEQSKATGPKQDVPQSAAVPQIVFEDLCKTYVSAGRSVEALRKVNLTIERGDICGIIGFSGAGKSTLLRMINALETPSSGRVLINAVDVEKQKRGNLRRLRKGIGMIFQQFNLLNAKTVAQNIALPLILNHESQAVIAPRVQELIEFVGLGGYENAYPAQLSGGQKQRVGIARALATAPEILLCDEATSALDPETTESILQLLLKVNRQLKVTIVFVTHMIEVITRLCNKVAVMERGAVIEQGSVREVFARPQQEVTRRFVQAVIPSALPPAVVEFVRRTPEPYKLVKIHFEDEGATEDLIWQLNSRFSAVRSNVMFASVHELQGVVLSHMVLLFTGAERDLEEVLAYITAKGFDYEEVQL
ncbi:MAG: ATP-binding cassette domain-containing protein [Succinivibrio sp.]|nr:ATP-binding cassette domain-containing protein [Succinivibrio sp.]